MAKVCGTLTRPSTIFSIQIGLPLQDRIRFPASWWDLCCGRAEKLGKWREVRKNYKPYAQRKRREKKGNLKGIIWVIGKGRVNNDMAETRRERNQWKWEKHICRAGLAWRSQWLKQAHYICHVIPHMSIYFWFYMNKMNHVKAPGRNVERSFLRLWYINLDFNGLLM